MPAYLSPLTLIQPKTTSCIPIDRAQLSSRRQLSTPGVVHAVSDSRRDDSKHNDSVPFAYRVGGALPWKDPTYIRRKADSELLSAIKQGQFTYVLGPRQMGKSSLRIQARHQLVQQGYRCVTIQANQICSPSLASAEPALGALAASDQTASNQKACSTFISTLWTQLKSNATLSLREWLGDTAGLSGAERLSRFSQDILASELRKAPIVVFIDEIDALLETPFLSLLLQWIEHCSSNTHPIEARQGHLSDQTGNPYKDLTFVLLGTATVSALCHSNLSPAQSEPSNGSILRLFSNGCQISLPTFQLVETFSLNRGFAEKIEVPATLLTAIFKWTQGQPFLTQKLCHIAKSLIGTLVGPSTQPIVLSPRTVNDWIDDLVRSHLIKHWTIQDDPIHFRAIRDRLLYSHQHKDLLRLYQAIFKGNPTRFDNTPIQAELLLTGLVTIIDNQLQVANPIYQEVFQEVCSVRGESLASARL